MNETIKTQLNHRSIRQFKPVALAQEEVNLLVDVARHAPTSNFRQAYSIISITDQKLKEEIAEILTHAAFYVGWPKAWAAFRMAKEVW